MKPCGLKIFPQQRKAGGGAQTSHRSVIFEGYIYFLCRKLLANFSIGECF